MAGFLSPEIRTKHGTLFAMNTKKIIVGHKERVAAFVAGMIGQEVDWGSYEAIGLEQNGVLIAGMVVNGYVRDARCCMHLAGQGKRWINREFIRVCMDYAFGKLNCKVLVGLVDADNEQALAFDRHFGFKDLCVLKDGAGDCDLIVLQMRRDECRWWKGCGNA